MQQVTLRLAVPADAALIAELIAEHARGEGAAACGRPEGYARGLEERAFACVIAQREGEALGLAMFYRTFSSWAGQPGLFLEDLYVRPAARGLGIGRLLLAELARIAQDSGATRIDLAVREANRAGAFYTRLGLRRLPGWLIWRAEGAVLAGLADES